MQIKNHELDDGRVKHLKNLVGPPITPELIVIHYGVTDSLDALVATQKARGYWAHLSIDGYTSDAGGVYHITQALPFNMRGSHAGPSEYKGRKAVSNFSIGIEIANPGPLIRGPDGKLRTVYKKIWAEDDCTEARHKYNPSPRDWNNWASYSDQEIDLCVEICLALKAEYSTISDVVGHDDIAPGRKFDPGPAFPIGWLREKVFGG